MLAKLIGPALEAVQKRWTSPQEMGTFWHTVNCAHKDSYLVLRWLPANQKVQLDARLLVRAYCDTCSGGLNALLYMPATELEKLFACN